MLLILELLFFGMGIYGLVTAKLPSWFVGKGFFAEGNEARLLSGLMIVPLPLAFCAGLALGIIDPDLIWVGGAVEAISIIAVAIIVVVALRRIRKPIETKPIDQQFKQE